MANTNKGKKVTMNFDSNAIRSIEVLQEATRDNMSGVLRDALGLYAWVHRESQKGNKLILKDKDGTTREILMRFAYFQDSEDVLLEG